MLLLPFLQAAALLPLQRVRPLCGGQCTQRPERSGVRGDGRVDGSRGGHESVRAKSIKEISAEGMMIECDGGREISLIRSILFLRSLI